MIKHLPQLDNFLLSDLFLVLSFANNYNTKAKEVYASNWRVCPNKLKNCVKCYFKLIQLLKSKRIKIGNYRKDAIYIYSLNGVCFHIKKSRKNSIKRFYSHKLHGPGVAYKVGITIFKNNVLEYRAHFKLQNQIVQYSKKITVLFTWICHKERKDNW